MKKNIILLGALVISSVAYAQVGINNEAPKATLDVTAKTTDNTTAEGIIAPRLSGDDIKGKDTQYTIDQKGAIVYATAAVGSASTKTANITSEGYYYFDGAIWSKFGSGTATAGAEPWYNSAGNIPATANNQNIYQMGKVGINKSTVPTHQLDVTGDLKANYVSGGVNNGINTNYPGLGEPANIMYVANNEDIASATNSSLAFVTPNMASIQSSKATGGGSITAYSTPNGGNVGFFANSVAASTTSSIWGYNNSGGQNYLELSHNKSNAEVTTVKLEKLSGVNFTFRTPANAFEGNYTFPRNNGNANQVLTTDGTAGLEAKLSWKDVSSLVTVPTEPWNVQGGTTPATTNAQNIYQAGNVSIGSQTPIAPFTSNSVTITPKLSVTGNVATTGSYYTTTGKYADYVFEDYFDGASKIDETYKFKSLEETAAYIKANKHLPGVTSIKDILKTENGYTVNLSELSIQQLEKIEELYLHTIEQQQEIVKQKTEINDLKSRMEKLEQLLVKENNNK